MPRPELETDQARSALMARVRQHGTEPELVVRRLLSELGIRYRLNVRGLPGSPDIASKTARKAIFVHGCYWHRHQGCRRTTTPKRNRAFWEAKFTRNRERDREKQLRLGELGYDVLVVWECETEDPASVRRRLRTFWGER